MRFGRIALLVMVALLCVRGISAQEKPLTKQEVVNLVKHQFGDETGARSIQRRGIDFDPTPDFVESLKDAGANSVFISALTHAKHSGIATKTALSQVQILALLGGQVKSHRVAMLVAERGIDFTLDDGFTGDVRRGGGDDELIGALRDARVNRPASVDPAAASRELEVRRHVSSAIEFEQKGQFAEAEQELRAALQLWPNDPTLKTDLASVLQYEEKWNESIALNREVLRSDPNNEVAHISLGVALGSRQDIDGAIAEFREALRIEPNDDGAHYNLGVALMNKDDVDGAIAEYREAIRINPRNASAHNGLGMRLRFDKHDLPGALEQFRLASELDPGNASFKSHYEDLSREVNQ